MGFGRALLNDNVKPYISPYHGKFSPHKTGGTIGAISGAIGGAVLGAGVPYGATGTEGSIIGMGMGAAAGALALPALGGIGALSSKVLMNPPDLIKGAGAVGNGMKKVGQMATSPMAKEVAAHTPNRRYVDRASSIAGSFMKFTPEEVTFDKAKNQLTSKSAKMSFSKKGVGALVGIAGVLGTRNLAQDAYDSKIGTPTGTKKATPNYLDNAGATGDLVFAMHQNRRG